MKRALLAVASLLAACNSPAPEQGGTQGADETETRYLMFQDSVVVDDGVNPSGSTEALGKGEYGICTYDAAHKRTVLFTGRRDEAGDEPATWSWNGNSWTAHGGVQPRAASRYALGFDEARGVTVLYGGRSTGAEALHEVWEFDGETWTASAPTDSYPAEEGGHFAYDRPSGALVYMASGEHPWTWDGSQWHESTKSVGSYARKITSATTEADGHAVFLERELGARNQHGNLRDVPHLLRYTETTLRREDAPYSDHVYLDTTRGALMYVGFNFESEGKQMGMTYADYACASFDTDRGRWIRWSPEAPTEVSETSQLVHPPGEGRMLMPYSWLRRAGQQLAVGFPYMTSGTDGLSDRYSGENLPAGLRLVESGVHAGFFDWTPTAEQVGHHEFTITVNSKGRNGAWTSKETYAIDVLPE